MSEKRCIKCNGPFGSYDVALHKKMVNRGATEFMCSACLARWLGITEEALLQKIDQFKKQGCTLFL